MSRITVLLADDDVIVVEALASLCEKTSISSAQFVIAERWLEVAGEHKPDVIVTDISDAADR